MDLINFLATNGTGGYSISVGDPKSGNHSRKYYLPFPDNQASNTIHLYGSGNDTRELKSSLQDIGLNVVSHPWLELRFCKI